MVFGLIWFACFFPFSTVLLYWYALLSIVLALWKLVKSFTLELISLVYLIKRDICPNQISLSLWYYMRATMVMTMTIGGQIWGNLSWESQSGILPTRLHCLHRKILFRTDVTHWPGRNQLERWLEKAWLPSISHKVSFFFSVSFDTLSWVVLSFSLLSQNLLNFLLKKGVLFSYYVFLREAEIHYDQCSWAKRVQRDCYLWWKTLFPLSPLDTSRELLEMERRFLFYNWVPMHMALFLWFKNFYMAVGKVS